MSLIPSYTVWLSDRLGVRKKSITDFIGSTALQYARAVNQITSLTITLPLNSEYADLFSDPNAWLDYRIEVWRRVGNGDEYLDTETIWFIRGIKKNLTQGTITLTAYSANEILTRRIIAYAAGTPYTQKSDLIDDMMKYFVAENLGSSATDADRDYSGYITNEGLLSQGDLIDKAATYKNLNDTLLDLSQQSLELGTAPIYFDVVGIITDVGVGNLEFRTYLNQRGNDRTTTSQLYSITLTETNLDNIEINYDLSKEINYVYVGGTGEGSLRATATVSDTDKIAASPINRREGFTSYNSNLTGTLQSEGYQKLRENAPRKIISAEIRNTETLVYGRDWTFGDKLTAEIDGEVFDVIINAVSVTLANNKEVVKAVIRGEI